MPSLSAGQLRHRVAIQKQIETRDTTTGIVKATWATIDGMESVPCDVVPLSAKEFIAANAMQSEVTTRVTLRYISGFNAKMRFLYRGMILNPAGKLADDRSGFEYMTIPCSEGVNDGQ